MGAGGASGAMNGAGGTRASGSGGTGASAGAGCAERAVIADAEFDEAGALSFPIPPPYDDSSYATWTAFGDDFGGGYGSRIMSTYSGGLTYSFGCTGERYTDWGGGCIMIINAQDLAALGYNTFEFWARATTPLETRVSLPDRNSAPEARVCDDAPAGCLENCCFDHYGIDISIGSEWALHRHRFDELDKIDNNGPPGPFDPTYVREIDFRVAAGTDFEFFVDDIAFLACSD